MDANPTTRIQERIIKVIDENKKPMSLTAIADKSNTSIYQVKSSIDFLEKLGILRTLVTSGGSTFILKKEKEDDTRTTNN